MAALVLPAVLVVDFCERAVAQPATNPECAAAREFLKEKGYDPAIFPRAEFDPKTHDPLFDLVAWSSVSEGLQKVVQQQIGLDRAPDLSLQLRSKNGKIYRFQFNPQPKGVENHLKSLLGVDDMAFAKVRMKAYGASRPLRARDFQQQYLDENGEVDLASVRDGLANLQYEAGPLKSLGKPVNPVMKTGKYSYVETSWVVSELQAGPSPKPSMILDCPGVFFRKSSKTSRVFGIM